MKGHYGTGDYTRPTEKKGKHYSSVRMQQGRVQLDSDWNEEVDIIDHRWRATLEDVVGASGVPKVGGGFGITTLTGYTLHDLLLSPGRIYVDGILCELDADYLDATVIDASTLSVPGFNAGETTFALGGWLEVSESTSKVLLQTQLIGVKRAGSTVTLNLGSPLSPLPAPSTAIRVRPIISYLSQPDLPAPPPIDMFVPTNQYYGKTYIAYLDVFQRHHSALDDPEIREVALNGPDTGTRNRTTWQVRLLDVTSQGASASCATANFPSAGTGRMQARAVPTSDPTQDCLLPAEAGYRRLENQLYRVEIHNPGDYAHATFKWSRDNGSVVVEWIGTDTNGDLKVKGAPQDSAEAFASGQWVELTDDVHELWPNPAAPGDPVVLGTLVRLGAPAADALAIDVTTKTGSVTFTDFSRHPKVRRWDSPGAIAVNAVGPDDWILLEDGVEVKFPAGGEFNKGDYWLIPARTATTDIEWPNDPPGVPVAQLPRGVEHRYCGLALIQVHSGGTLTILDCRPQFPALTAIAASDVSYDNANCHLVNATNVQQAIDALCKCQDLAHHNKLIHGYGIVGGLQLECDTPPLWVKLRAGYAIDCNGKDIEVDDTSYDVGVLMKPLDSSPLDKDGNGEISLVIGLDRNAQVQVTAEKFTPSKNEVNEVFSGTLLLDAFDDCVKPLQAFLAKELSTGAQGLASAFVNLLAQGPNPQAGQNVYISAREHELLGTFYNDLRKWLHSDTFCGLFEHARDFPKTPADTTLGHMFGNGQHHRIKWRPSTKEIFTIGNGTDPTKIQPMINRYDSGTHSQLEWIDPTGGVATGPIIDFTFSPDGTTIYVILEASNKTDTLYRSGSITAGGVNWSSQLVTFTGVRLKSLESYWMGSSQLIAVGEGTGSYKIDPAVITYPSMQLQPEFPLSPINATGHLAISEIWGGWWYYAAVPWNSDPKAKGTTYDRIRIVEIWSGGGQLFDSFVDITVPPGSDGVVWGGQWGFEVYAVVGTGTKSIVGYTATSNWQQITDNTGNPMSISVDNCAIRITTIPYYFGNQLLWASEDFYTLNLVDLNSHLPVASWTLPTEVGPSDLVYSLWAQELAVLNRPSDSILTIPRALIAGDAATIAKVQAIFNAVVAYHKAAVEAYVDLIAGFLQYLKDCFCHHFLVKCAECTPATQKLYLGVVSIRGGKVYNVCNFSQRHYLKTFPTMGYWLSLFPIIPMISELVEMLCCYLIPDAAAKYSVPAYSKPLAGSTPQWSLQSLFESLQDVQGWDVRGKLNLLLQQFGLARHVVGFSAGFRQLAPPPTPPPGGYVIGSNVIAARGALAQRGLVAKPTPIPTFGPRMIPTLIDIFRPPASPTGPVALHQAGGKVVFTSNPREAPQVATLQAQLLAKDTQLQLMQTQLDAVTVQVQELHVFRQQVTALLKPT